MNKVGLHMGYWIGTGKETDVFSLLELTESAGVDVLEVLPAMILNLSHEKRADLKKAIADKDMFLSINGGLTDTNDISSDDPSIRKIGIEFCKSVLGAASETGANRWSGVNYSAWLKRPCRTLDVNEKRRVMDLSLTSMRSIIKTAEDEGVTYCFEVVNRYEQFLFNTAEEGVAYAEEVGSPNAKLLIDTFHMNIEEDSITDAILYTAKHGKLGHFHVGESNRRVPGIGKGHIQWADIFDSLKNVGYKEFITMEPFVTIGHRAALNVCVWRDLSHGADLDKLIADAHEGAGFVRSFLE